MDIAATKAMPRSAANDAAVTSRRFALAHEAAEVFHNLSVELWLRAS